MNPMLLVVLLAIGWVAITGGMTLANLALGVAIAGFVLFLLRDKMAQPLSPARAWAVILLALLFVKELLLSAVGVARLVLTPALGKRLRPAIIAYPLQARSDVEITLLANLITLTPGTLTVDVSPDRKRLYIHVLSLESEEKLIASIHDGFERRVMDIFL